MDRLKRYIKEDNFYSYMLMICSAFCLFCSTILLVDGFQCNCGVGSNYEDPISFLRTCKKCTEKELDREPGEQVSCEPGLTFGAFFGSFGIFFGMILAALWRDSIDTDMLTQKHENEIDVSTATAVIETRSEGRRKQIEKQVTTSSYFDDTSMMDMDY